MTARGIEIERDALRIQLQAWHAECDKVGIPYDPAGLVRHHRGNAALEAHAATVQELIKTAKVIEAVKTCPECPRWFAKGDPFCPAHDSMLTALVGRYVFP